MRCDPRPHCELNGSERMYGSGFGWPLTLHASLAEPIFSSTFGIKNHDILEMTKSAPIFDVFRGQRSFPATLLDRQSLRP